MALSSDLISQFVKITQDKEEPIKETTAYGKIVVKDGKEYVQLDGSELLTPISTTTVVKDEDRVMVTIKNHTAIVTGDLTNPSASNKDVTEIGSKITEFEILIGDKVTTEQLEAEIARIEQLRTEQLEATNAKIETLEGKVAKIDQIETDILDVSGKVTANEAEIDTLRADIADFKDVTADRIDAVEGNFNNLSSDYAEFEETTTTKLLAAEADIKDLETNKLDTETADIKYATIDFSNIGEAAIEKLFSDSGIIKDLIMSDGKVTGELVGVTIKGDIIEGNTVKADKLVILGEDGLYYKLNVDSLGEATASSDEKYQNGLDGSAILAESITAEKIAVDDLVAFGATIGGFHINEHAIYSGVKESMTNTTPGLHMTDDGQINIGDSNQFLKYYIDENGNYKLEIQADSIKFGSSGTTIEQYIENAKEPISKTTEGYPLVITDGVKVIDFEIDGKTEQLITTASSNICPPPTDSNWVLEGGAYLDSDGAIHLPDLTSKAYIIIPWNKRSNKMNLIYTITSGGNAHVNTGYLDENKHQVSGNGAAFMDKPDGYTHTSYFGGDNVYGEALGAAEYVAINFIRSESYAPNPYVIKDISVSINDSTYTPFVPNSPSPDYPSEIESVGYDNKFDKNNVTLNKYIEPNGVEVTSSLSSISNYCNVNENTNYLINYGTIESYWKVVCFYDRNKTFLSYLQVTDESSITKFITPNNCKYLRFHCYTANLDEVYLIEGTKERDYLPFGKYGIELVHRGRNLIDVLGYRPKGYTTTIEGITYTVLEDGQIKVNGTATAKSVFYIAENVNITITDGVKTISGGSANVAFQLSINKNGTYVYPTVRGITSYSTYTNSFIKNSCLVVSEGQTVNNEIVYLQFEDGDKATDYEQHFMSSVIFELDEPLRSLPSGLKDIARINRSKLYVDRYTGDMVLDGTEGWVLHSTYPHTFSIPLSEVINMHGRGYCTHFKSIPTSKWGVENGIYDAYTLSLYISHLESDTVEEFKTWLSNNNVKLVYELETPITEEVGEVDIPMYKNKTNIYYIGNEVEPDRLYCEYYTLYAERVADLDNGIDEVSASISIEAGKIVEEATDSIISRVTNIEKKQDVIDDDIETLTSKVEAAITEDDVTILINKELDKGVDKVTTSTGFTFNEEGLNISKTGKLMDTTINENGMVVQRGDEDRLVANDEGVVAYNLHAKTYLVIGSSSRFEDYIKKTETVDGGVHEEPRTGCFWVGDIGGVY